MFILLILIQTLLLKNICEAELITTTSTIAISTTMTETSTQLVLGFCVSQLDGPCRRKKQYYYQPYYPSFYGQIQSRNKDAFLYSPSSVEKYVFLFFYKFENLHRTFYLFRLEVSLIDPGEGRFLFRNNEGSIITQSSLKEDNLLDNYNPYLYLRDGSSLSGRPLPTFFFFRPFANLWSSLVRATRTVYQTITKTFTTTSFVQSTTSTATLFIKKCEDPANSAVLHNTFLKCPQEASIASSTTPFSSSTIPTTITNSPMILESTVGSTTGEATTITNGITTTHWTSTTSQTTPITDETTPISSSTSSTTTSHSSITIHTTLDSTTESITNVPLTITNETTSTNAGTSTTSQTTFTTDQTFSTTKEATTESITTAETTTDSITTDQTTTDLITTAEITTNRITTDETTTDWLTTDETTTDLITTDEITTNWITTDETTTNWITTDETSTGWITTDETTTDWTTPTDGPCTTDETSTDATDTTTEGTIRWIKFKM